MFRFETAHLVLEQRARPRLGSVVLQLQLVKVRSVSFVTRGSETQHRQLVLFGCDVSGFCERTHFFCISRLTALLADRPQLSMSMGNDTVAFPNLTCSSLRTHWHRTLLLRSGGCGFRLETRNFSPRGLAELLTAEGVSDAPPELLVGSDVTNPEPNPFHCFASDQLVAQLGQ